MGGDGWDGIICDRPCPCTLVSMEDLIMLCAGLDAWVDESGGSGTAWTIDGDATVGIDRGAVCAEEACSDCGCAVWEVSDGARIDVIV